MALQLVQIHIALLHESAVDAATTQHWHWHSMNTCDSKAMAQQNAIPQFACLHCALSRANQERYTSQAGSHPYTTTHYDGWFSKKFCKK